MIGEERGLIRAVRGGDVESALRELKAGADPNEPDHRGCSPLALAAKHSTLEMVESLLAAGADPDGGEREKASNPLMWAAWRNEKRMVAVLLEAGADPDAVDEGGRAALMIAADYGRENALLELLEGGADPRLKDRDGKTAEDWGMAKLSRDLMDLLKGRRVALEERELLESSKTARRKGSKMRL